RCDFRRCHHAAMETQWPNCLSMLKLSMLKHPPNLDSPDQQHFRSTTFPSKQCPTAAKAGTFSTARWPPEKPSPSMNRSSPPEHRPILHTKSGTPNSFSCARERSNSSMAESQNALAPEA